MYKKIVKVFYYYEFINNNFKKRIIKNKKIYFKKELSFDLKEKKIKQ